MPVKNTIKTYIENGYYHTYNQGVEKRTIFQDHQDYIVFLSFLKRYLAPPAIDLNKVRPRFRIDLSERIQLIAYCLMPNHFHLLIKQFPREAMTDFMRALVTSYVYYFNQRYKRTGPLFQSKYKAVLIENDTYLLHLTRYIHLNPTEIMTAGSDLVEYKYSSYKDFLEKRNTVWVHPEEILHFFKNTQKVSFNDVLSYQSFVEDYKQDPRETLGSLIIEY